MNLYDLPARAVDQFDIVFFHGLLYHLPDPVTGLRVAADHPREPGWGRLELLAKK